MFLEAWFFCFYFFMRIIKFRWQYILCRVLWNRNKIPKNLRKGPFRIQSFCRCQWQHKNKIIGRKQISFDYQMKYLINITASEENNCIKISLQKHNMYDMTIYVTMAEAVKWKARKKHRHKQVYQYFQLHKNICRNDKKYIKIC